MTREIKLTRYACATCDAVYDRESDAARCEARSISHDRGVKIGDTVRITAGDCSGSDAKVERVYIISMEWGHYAYWHTVALDAKVIGSYGHRMLTFDDYEIRP